MEKQGQSDKQNGKRRGVLSGVVIGAAAGVLIVSALYMTGVIDACQANPLVGQNGKIVGKDVSLSDITQFYYTYSTSTYPPEYQRYRFSAEGGKYLFYHEKREGEHWPLREEDVTVSGTLELSQQQWAEFFAHLKDGEVRNRRESVECGSSGPWLFLYWKGDRSKCQEFSFASWEKKTSFEEFCVKLKLAQLNSKTS